MDARPAISFRYPATAAADDLGQVPKSRAIGRGNGLRHGLELGPLAARLGPDDGARFETLTTLGAMANATSTVRLGALTFGNLYRDPVTLAKSATMVDHISGGRLELAIGAAWGNASSERMGFPTRTFRSVTGGSTSRSRS